MSEPVEGQGHTPGEWRADVYGGDWWVWANGSDMVADYSSDFAPVGTVARLRGVGRGATDAEMAANARLMAASPKLLEALRGLMPFVGEDFEQDEEVSGTGYATPAYAAAYRAARSAIRLATGR
jgi:hypothetical protein